MKFNKQLFYSILICSFGLVFSTYIFYPGFISFDSFSQYEQLSSGAYSNAHPAMMTRVWAIADKLIKGPGGIFLLHQFMYWLGISFIIRSFRFNSFYSTLAGLALGFFPPYYLISLHIWKDAAMLAGLSLFTGLYLHMKSKGPLSSQSRGVLAVMLVSLTYALGVRHNSVLATIPLFYLIGRELLKANGLEKDLNGVMKATALSVILFVSSLTATKLVNSYKVRKGKLFPMIYVWDMAAISLKEKQVLLPDEIILEKVDTLNKLEKVFRNNVNNTISSVVSFYPQKNYIPYWLELIGRYPSSYFAHRNKVFAELITIDREMAYYPFHPGIDEDPFKKRNFRSRVMPTVYYEIINLARWLSGTFIYKAFLYLILSIGLISWFLYKYLARKSFSESYFIAGIFGLSGALYVLPLYFFAPASDFRYNVWMIFLSILGAIIAALEKKKLYK